MSRVHTFIREDPSLVMPSPASSDLSQDSMSPNEVPREYIMGPSPEPAVAELASFPWHYQRASFGASSAPHGIRQQRQQKGKQPQQQQHQRRSDQHIFYEEEPVFNPSRLAHEQRLSACLNTLRHILRILRIQHHEAEQHLEGVSRLISQTSWDLFFQSPQDFINQEMMMMTTTTIPTPDVPEPQFIWGEPAAWTRCLRGLRMMGQDEAVMRQSVERLEKQIRYVAALLGVGSREQAAILRGGDPLVDNCRRAFDRSARNYGQTTKQSVGGGLKSNNGHAAAAAAPGASANTSASTSTFRNWPQPRRSWDDEASNCDCQDHRAPSVSQESDHASSTEAAGVSSNVQAMAAALQALSPQELLMVLKAFDSLSSSS